MHRPAIVVAALSLLAAAPASALHPLATDDTGTVGGSMLELELSSRIDHAPANATTLTHGFAAHAGLLDTVDVGATMFVETDARSWKSQFGTPVVDLKLRLATQAGWRPGAGVRLDFQLPVTGEQQAALGGHLLTSWELGILAFHLNAGANWRALPDVWAGWLYVFAARADLALDDALSVGAEAFVETGRTRCTTLLGGLILKVSDRAALSAGLGSALSGSGAAWVATVGLTAMLGDAY